MSATTLGRYRIVRELGRGAMGRVFLAHDDTIDRPVALKTMQAIASLPEGERAAARERFAREARAAGRLSHPGIVTIFDVGESDGVPYLAMEYLEGQTLDAFATPETRLPLPEVVALIAQAADALHFAHGRAGVVHRDIKPGNMMRVAPGRVKILDFGLAKTPLAAMTQDGTVLGTPSYMAPEQVRGAAVDGRADLFSLAVVLFELVTGQKPFPGDSVSTVLYRIVHEEPQLPPPTPAGVPPGLHAFLQRALAKDPADRFPDAHAFARALRGALLTTAGEPKKREALPPPPPPPRLRSRGGSLLPWVIAAAVVLGGAGYAVVRLGARNTPAVITPPQAAVRVRTDPPGLPVTLNGKPLEKDTVTLPAAAPFGILAVTQGCRTVKRTLTAGDAGGEIVLVPDPVRGSFSVAPEAQEAQVSLNGGPATQAPASLDLDLCAANAVEVTAPGYRPARVEVAPGATPLAARTLLAGIALEKIPEGTLRLPSTRFKVNWHVDGASASGGEVALPEGTHAVRAVNAAIWLDRTLEVEVKAGETVTPDLDGRLADLVVQAFPANCRVALRRGEGDPWKEVDETPLRTAVFPGSFQVRVTYLPTGEAQEREVKLRPGANPPVRFSFRSGA
ncbi:MAG TPA: serine/threonine-protein kinase [Candidatus Polarisedimenticolaceae bacterium]|nr:serine/threonine-protein kinase [Candidatus Polarisedimenticolaceae bacterium]